MGRQRREPGGSPPQSRPDAKQLPVRRFDMYGSDQRDIIIPRLVIHQGSNSEGTLGCGEPGSWYDTGRREPIGQGDSVFATVIFGWIEYLEWRGEKGKLEGLAARSLNEKTWPAEALEWTVEDEVDKRTGEPKKVRKPPRVTRYRSFLLLIQGYDRPLCLSCRPWLEWGRLGRFLIASERGRESPGRYKLGTRNIREEKRNFWVPTWEPPTDPPYEMAKRTVDLYPKMRPLIETGRARAELTSSDAPGSPETPAGDESEADYAPF